MEHSPHESKPNRVFRGRVVRAVLAEVFDWRRKTTPEDIGYEPIGIGAADLGQLTIYDVPEEWHNWPTSSDESANTPTLKQ